MKDFFNNISSQMNDLTQWLHITSLPPKVVSTIHQRAEEKYNYLNNEQDQSLSNTLALEYANKHDIPYNFLIYNKELCDSIPFPEMVSYLLEEDAIKINHDKFISLKDLKKEVIINKNIETNVPKTYKKSDDEIKKEDSIKKEKPSNKIKPSKTKENSNFDLNKIVDTLDKNFSNKENKDNKKIKFSVKKKSKNEKNYAISEINIENIGLTLENEKTPLNREKFKNSIQPIAKKEPKNEKNLEIDLIKSFQEENEISPNLKIENIKAEDLKKDTLIETETSKKEEHSLILPDEINNPLKEENSSNIDSEKLISNESILNQEAIHNLTVENHLNDTVDLNNTIENLNSSADDIIPDNAHLLPKEIEEVNDEENRTNLSSKKEVDFSIPSFLLEPEKKENEDNYLNSINEKNEQNNDDSIELENKKDISHDKFKEDMKEKRRKIYTQTNGLPDIKAKREKFKLYQQQKESMYKQAVIEFLKNNPHIFEKYGKENMSWEDIEKMAVDSSKSSE